MAEFYRSEALQATIAQLHGLRGEINASKQKTLYQLFGSSFAILFWVGSFFFGKASGPAAVTLLLIMPLVFNAFMWALWLLFRLFLFGPFPRHFERDDSTVSDRDIHALYMDYEALKFALQRERRIESAMDLLTAVQFILMALILAYALLGASSF